MKQQHGVRLLEKLRDGSITEQERIALESWYLHYAETAQPLSDTEAYKRNMAKLKEAFPFATELPVQKNRLWPRIATVPIAWKIAAAVAAIPLGTWVYLGEIASSRNASRNDEVVTSMNDIKPGSVGATLTLANGKTIKLSSAINGELAKEAGVTIKKAADGQLVYAIASSQNAPRNDGAELKTNTLSTAKGETYQVKLPDGTAVWLNAASSLTYSASLTAHGKRVVRLSGEAFFQVAKDKSHPFIVESKGQQVEVLGTQFNINSYKEEEVTKTTLLEGAVSISSGGQSKILKPGQQSVLSGTDKLTVKDVNIEEATAWKNNDFYFRVESMESVMRKVSRWYNITVSYTDEELKKVPISGFVSRSKPLSVVLDRLGAAGLMRFKIEGQQVTVIAR